MDIKSTRKNAIINVMGWFIPALVLLFITPILVNKLGTDGFGVLVIIQILTGYMSILNFGFSEAIIKQVAESHGNNENLMQRTMWCGLILFILAGLLGSITIYLSSTWLINDVLDVPEELISESIKALNVGAAIFFLQMIAEYFRGTAIGCSMFLIPNASRITRISLSSIMIVYVLYDDGGIDDVMWATLAGLVIGLFINIIWMQIKLPLKPAKGEYREIFSSLLHFGKHIFFARLASTLSSKLNQLVLGSATSISNVALYAVPTRAADAASTILSKLLQVFFPEFSSLKNKSDINRVKRIYKSVISIQLLITLPLLTLVILEGDTLLALWISEEFSDDSSSIITIIAISYFLSSMTNLPTYTAMSFNQPQIISKYSLFRALIVAVIVYPLIDWQGLYGAALVLLIAELLAIPYIYEATKSSLSISIFKLFSKQIIRHIFIMLTIITIYTCIIKGEAWYSPWFILPVVLLHFALILLFVTTQEDNNKLYKVIKIWD